MSGGGSKKEPRSAKELRNRQLMDLADLDEKENRRIKALFRARQGGRAFRSPVTSVMPASGFNTQAGVSSGQPSSLRVSPLKRVGGA